MIKEITKAIQIVFREKNYIAIAGLATVVFAYVIYWLLYKVTTIPAFLQMTRAGEFGPYSYAYATAYWLTTIATIIIFGISVAFLTWLWRHSRLSKGASGSGFLGMVAGMLGSACPICGAFLLSFLGVTSGVFAFPLQGLEFKFLSLALIVGSTVIAARKVVTVQDCAECADVSLPTKNIAASAEYRPDTVPDTFTAKNLKVFPLEKALLWLLIILFIINQFFISSVLVTTGAVPKGGISRGGVARLFGIKTAGAYIVIAPKLNPDGKTTSLVEQPTITEVPANPNTGDAVVDAKVVMFPTGKPFYAPDDISFDDPINAQKKWKAIGFGMQLTKEQEARWNNLKNTFTCNYCCGGPNNVTTIARCGCAHSYAWQGFFRYMIATYGDTYTDDQLKGEAYRWTGIWYPKGVLEDYLLATGKGDVMGHQTHGGAGSDSMHGLGLK